MAKPAEGRVVPFQRYYLCIDGTPAVDSVEYGRSLEKMFGWRNLLVEFLQPVPSEAGTEPGTPPRLHDPNHPYLPIYAFPVTDRKPVAVVCPSGLHGRGLDEFWRAYKGETPEEQQNHGKVDWPKGPSGTRGVTYGRYSALEKCARFMPDLILSPTIEHVSRNGKDFAQLKQGHLPGSRHDPPQADIHAQLLFVSSHGWKAGFMRGDNMQEDKTAEPKDAQYAFTAGYYFMAGYAAEAGLFFNGPKWVILA